MLQNETVTSLISKCQQSMTCLCLDRYHNLAPKVGQGGHGGNTQLCQVTTSPGHNDKLKYGVKLARTIWACFSELKRGKPKHHFRRIWVLSGSSAKLRPGDGTVLNYVWACGADTANSQALVAVALPKRLLNSRFSTFSESKCCLGGEWRTCWLNIVTASCKWVKWVMGGKGPERELLAEAM